MGETTINHPPVITIFIGWYGYHSQLWVVYGLSSWPLRSLRRRYVHQPCASWTIRTANGNCGNCRARLRQCIHDIVLPRSNSETLVCLMKLALWFADKLPLWCVWNVAKFGQNQNLHPGKYSTTYRILTPQLKLDFRKQFFAAKAAFMMAWTQTPKVSFSQFQTPMNALPRTGLRWLLILHLLSISAFFDHPLQKVQALLRQFLCFAAAQLFGLTLLPYGILDNCSTRWNWDVAGDNWKIKTDENLGVHWNHTNKFIMILADLHPHDFYPWIRSTFWNPDSARVWTPHWVSWIDAQASR